MSLASDFSSGKGGLEFTTQSPPGLGRLVRIPFYINANQANAEFQVLVPGAAIANFSTTSPIVAAGLVAAGSGPIITMETPAISWATLRLVGFEADINFPPNAGAAVAGADAQAALTANNTVQLLLRDLQIGGGATLFVHEDFANASIYSSSNDNFAGLRDYPLIKSPNVAQVDVSLFQNTAGATPSAANLYAAQASQITFSLCLVCEIIQDDNYGSHVPGPYARSGAMVRRG